MESVWIAFAPFLVFFGWLMGQQQRGTACPHCGGALANDFGAIGEKPKAPDDELAGTGRGNQLGARNPLIVATISAVGLIVAVQAIYLLRGGPMLPPPAPPVVTPSVLPPVVVHPPLFPPSPASRPGGG